MSLKDKLAILKFEKPEIEVKTTAPISEEWSRLLDLIEPIYPEMYQFFFWLAEQDVHLKKENSGKSIVLDGECFAGLPAIKIDINPNQRWPSGDELL